MARAGALRIDHVMGLERLYWIPSGSTPAQGAYVRYPIDDLLGIAALESHRHRCLIIGEDLGTVSTTARAARRRARAFVPALPLRARDGGYKSAAEYPRRALVSWSTHDLPTLAGWWSGEDLRTRRALGLCDRCRAREPSEGARRRAQARIEALGRGRPRASRRPTRHFSEDLALAIQSFLAKTPSS
jgi:(1->4)-alpha-D-glucan 1-alpha-D-glucosylmutase